MKLSYLLLIFQNKSEKIRIPEKGIFKDYLSNDEVKLNVDAFEINASHFRIFNKINMRKTPLISFVLQSCLAVKKNLK